MSEDDEPFVIDDEPEVPTEPVEPFKIDQLRIDYFVALRRGAMRSRSWWLVGFVVAAIFILDMVVQSAVELLKFHLIVWPILRGLAIVPAALFAMHANKRAGEFKTELQNSRLPEPTTPPDFSTLSNGEDRWKNLENIR